MSNVNYGALDDDDKELNFVVDEFFSFIDDEPVLDDEMDDAQKRSNEDTVADGNSLTPFSTYVDEVLDKHFSFLSDEPTLEDEELFYSLDGHPKQTNLESSSLRGDTRKEDEPIYINISTVLSVRPKSKYESHVTDSGEIVDLDLNDKEPGTLFIPGSPIDGHRGSKKFVNNKTEPNNVRSLSLNKVDFLNCEQSEAILKSKVISQANLRYDKSSKDVDRISENLFQLGNAAVITISNENERKESEVESRFSPKASEEVRNSGKSSVYLNYEDPGGGWRKRQRKHVSAFNPAYTIKFNPDGEEPLVYSLCTPEALKGRKHNRTEDFPKSNGSHRQRSDSYAEALGINLEKASKVTGNASFSSDDVMKSRSESPVIPTEFLLRPEIKSEQKKNWNNEQSVTNFNCSLTASNEKEDVNREHNLNRYRTGFQEIDRSFKSGTYLKQQRSSKLSSSCDQNTCAIENIIPFIEVSSKVVEPSSSYRTFYDSPAESDGSQFFIGEDELDRNKNRNVEKRKNYFCLSEDDVSNIDGQMKIGIIDECNDNDVIYCTSQTDLEKLLSLDLQVQQLENKEREINADQVGEDLQNDYSFSNTVAEAINFEVIPSNDKDFVFTSETMSPLSHQSSFKSTPMTQAVSFDSEDEQIIKIELATCNSDNRIHLTNYSDTQCMSKKNLVRQRSFDQGSRSRELVLRSYSDGQNVTIDNPTSSCSSQSEALYYSANDVKENYISNSEVNTVDNQNLVSALSGVIRRSMKRMKHIRLSGRRSKNRSRNLERTHGSQSVSEETEARHHLPTVPQIGLPSVRSPTASAVLLPSLLAALTPNEPPREILPSPEEVMDQPHNHARSNSADYLNVHRTHHRSSEISRNLGNSTHTPTRTNSSSDGLIISQVEGDRVPSANQNSRQARRTTRSSSGNLNEEGGSPVHVVSGEETVDRRNTNSQNSEVPEHTVNDAPNTRLTMNGSPIPVHGRANQNIPVPIVSNSTSAINRRNNRHTRDTRELPRSRRCDNPRSNTSSNNTIINNNNNNNHNTSRSGANIINNNTNPNPTNDPRRTSRTPSRQTSSSRLSSDGDLRTNSERGRVMRPVTHPQGFKPPTRALWPHGHSGLMASLPVTLNMFNISRFAVLGAAFGWQFPIQWLVISLVVALPLMAFHAAIGQAIGGSVIDMWVISPIFQGVGYALLFVEIVMGIYCCLPVAWLFTYFRDSFDMRHFRCISLSACETPTNLSREINTYVTGFFSNHILQRSDNENSVLNSLGSVKFDLSFNIALIWVITFLALSRGARSYGKICYVIYFAPLVCYFSVCFYMMYWANNGLDLKNFGSRFIDRQPWLAASREAFLVWGLHGAVIQQMAAGNKKWHPVWRDTSTMAIFTICGLCFASFLGMLCVSALESKGLIHSPSSFENENTRAFVDVQIHFKDSDTILIERNQILGPPQYLRPEPVYDNFYTGIRVRDEYLIRMSPRIDSYRSGYNTLRLMTELFPALLFSKNGEFMSAWAPLFYLSLLLFGLAQQLSVWHTVVQGVLRLNYQRLAAWETFIAFCCCLFGFSAALPMASGAGIHIIYFLDYAIGSIWWIMILQLIMVFAVLFVRGKPFSAKDVAYKFFGEGRSSYISWTATPVAFFWTIIVPVGLLILSISSFKNGNYREVFAWASVYWSTFTCQMASTFQLFPLLLVPLVGLIQTCKYLADPRQDLFERIQHLYRPPLQPDDDDPFLTSSSDDFDPLQLPYNGTRSPPNETSSPLPYSDPPPKYTPPPSYSTATGSGFTKLFNRSFRTWRNTIQNQSTASLDRPDVSTPQTQSANTITEPFIPSPDYSPSISPPEYFQQSGYLNPAIVSESPSSCNSPPRYATLDPLRLQREFLAYNNGKSSFNRVEFQRPQNGLCQFCGAAQVYRLRQRRNSAGDVSNEVNHSTDSGQISETSSSRENEALSRDEAAIGNEPCIKQNRATTNSSQNLDSGMSSTSSGNCLTNTVTLSSRLNERYHPGDELSDGAEIARDSASQCTNPSCPSLSYSNHVNYLPRISSYPSNPFRRSSSLRRSWTTSLRRSARRIAAAISSTHNVRNRHLEGAILVSHISNNNLTSAPSSSQNISTQSEA